MFIPNILRTLLRTKRHANASSFLVVRTAMEFDVGLKVPRQGNVQGAGKHGVTHCSRLNRKEKKRTHVICQS